MGFHSCFCLRPHKCQGQNWLLQFGFSLHLPLCERSWSLSCWTLKSTISQEAQVYGFIINTYALREVEPNLKGRNNSLPHEQATGQQSENRSRVGAALGKWLSQQLRSRSQQIPLPCSSLHEAQLRPPSQLLSLSLTQVISLVGTHAKKTSRRKLWAQDDGNDDICFFTDVFLSLAQCPAQSECSRYSYCMYEGMTKIYEERFLPTLFVIVKIYVMILMLKIRKIIK